MKTITISCVRRAIGLGLLLCMASGFAVGDVRNSLQELINPSQSDPKNLSAKLAKARQGFMENKGQWPKSAKFVGQYPGLSLWLTDTGWKLDQYRLGTEGRSGQVIDVSFVGGNKKAQYSGLNATSGRIDYLRGKTSVRGIRRYSEVLAQDIYPGTDLRWYLDSDRARFDLIVHPGANPESIQMKIKGADSARIAANGDLVLTTPMGEVRYADLKAFQVIEGKTVSVDVAYKHLGKDKVGFEVGSYDRSKSLIIDPLVYGSYYGGDSGFDEVHGVVADADFGVFATGYTQAPDFPAIAGPYSFTINGTRDAFVSKFQGDAYNHDYSAYIGGSGVEAGQYAALDPTGTQLWIAGTTSSSDFPEVNGSSFQPARAGATDFFLMRFSKSDTEVLDPDYATYYGTAGTEILRAMAIAPVSGEIVLVGDTNGGLPSKNNSYLGGTTDAFMCRFSMNSTGIAGIKHCFYIGGTGRDTAAGVAIDANDNVIVGGTIFSGTVTDTSIDPSPFATTPGVYTNGRLLRQTDAFIRKYDTSGNVLYSALLGGNANDFALVGGYAPFTGSPVMTGNGVAVDPSGNAYITGISTSFNFPRTPGVFGENFSFAPVVYVTKINQDGSQIVYSTHLRTANGVNPSGIAVDSRGTAYIAGLITFSLSFPNPPGDPNEPNGVTFGTIPTTGGALDPLHESPTTPELPTTEGFLLALTPTATSLLYGTFIGGILDEQIYAPYVDRFGDCWVIGGTDVGRFYQRVSSTGAVTNYLPTGPRRGLLPGAILSPFGFKLTPDPTSPLTATVVSTPYGVLGGAAPAFVNCQLWRDGFLVKQRLTLPTITNVTLNPADVAGGLGATSVGNITLSGPVPAGGLDVTVTIDNAAASFSSSGPQNTLVIPIPGGATTAQFTLFTNPVTSPTQVTVRAELEGNFFIRVLTVEPWLQQLTITPTSVVGGNNVTGRVRLWQNAISDITIDLSTDTSGLVDFNGATTVVVPAGSDTATFTIRTHGVGPQTDVPVTASLLGVGKTAFVRLLPANLASVTFVPNRVTAGTSTVGTVTLDGEAGSTFIVNLTLPPGTPAGYVIDTPTLTFNQGDRSKTFNLTTDFEPVNTQRTVTATRPAQGPYSLQSVAGTIFVDAASLIAFTINQTQINPGGTATGTVTINVPAATGGAVVNVVADNPILTINSPVIIPAGATSVNFPITAANIAIANDVLVNITASRGGPGITRQLTVKATAATLDISPSTVIGGNNATGTLSIASPAGVGGLTFNLASDIGQAQVPASATILQGQTSTTFNITTSVVVGQVTATITATSGAVVASDTLVIRGAQVVEIKFVPSRVRGPNPTAMTVTLDTAAPPGDAVVTLVWSDPTLIQGGAPTSITIFAGNTSRTVNLVTRRVSRTLATQVQASYGASVKFAILTVTR